MKSELKFGTSAANRFSSRRLFLLCVNFHLCRCGFELGPPMKPPAGYGCAADCMYHAEDSFARRLVYHWTTLPPGDFYGTVVVIDPQLFPQLNTPGRWRLRGTYESTGDLSSSLCLDPAPLADNKKEVERLPYEDWQGTVETNTLWIEVLRAKTSTTSKKSQ